MTILLSITAKYEQRDIFNADEFGLFLNIFPSTSLVKGETYHGGKHNKEVLTVLIRANWMPLRNYFYLLLEKHKNHITLNTQKSSHVSTQVTRQFGWCVIHEYYLHALDAKLGSKNQKIILFVGQCPVHLQQTGNLRNICIQFISSNKHQSDKV
jgi:hypothetical protein